MLTIKTKRTKLQYFKAILILVCEYKCVAYTHRIGLRKFSKNTFTSTLITGIPKHISFKFSSLCGENFFFPQSQSKALRKRTFLREYVTYLSAYFECRYWQNLDSKTELRRLREHQVPSYGRRLERLFGVSVISAKEERRNLVRYHPSPVSCGFPFLS